MARAQAAEDAPTVLYELAGRLGAPRSPAVLGLDASDLPAAAAQAAGRAGAASRAVSADGVLAVLRAGHEARAPRTGDPR